MSLLNYIDRLKHMGILAGRKATGRAKDFAKRFGISPSQLFQDIFVDALSLEATQGIFPTDRQISKKTRIIAKVAVVVILFSSQFCRSQNIDDYFKAVGGKENWRKVTCVEVEAVVTYYKDKLNKPDKIHETKMVNSVGQYKVEWRNSGSDLRKLVYDGKRMVEFIGEEAVYEDEEGVINQYKKRDINFGEPWIALKADELAFVGEKELEHRVYDVFKVVYLGLVRMYYIEKDTHLLRKMSMFNGVTESVFDDYRDIKGYLVPFRRTGYINGEIELITEVQNVRINEPMAPSLFVLN